MFKITCVSCGFEQTIKKILDSQIYYQIKNSNAIFCDRKCCQGSKLKVPHGFINVYGIFGGWTIQKQITLNEYKSIKRAKKIRDFGIYQLNNQTRRK